MSRSHRRLYSSGRLRFSVTDLFLALAVLAVIFALLASVVRGIKRASSGEPALCLAFSYDGTQLAAGERGGRIRLWNLDDGAASTLLYEHTDDVLCVAFPADGSTMASASRDASAILWNLSTGKPRHHLQGHSAQIESLVFAPDGQTLVTASLDRTVRFWDVTTAVLKGKLTEHSEWIHSVDFSPDGEVVATGGEDGTVRLWDAQSLSEVASLETEDGWVRRVLFSPNGELLLALGSRLSYWDRRTGEERTGPASDLARPTCVAFSAGGKQFAAGYFSATGQGRVTIWDTGTLREDATIRTGDTAPVAIALSRDGRKLAVADTGVTLWDLSTRRRESLGSNERVNTWLFLIGLGLFPWCVLWLWIRIRRAPRSNQPDDGTC